jgi:hypothetical protein
MEQLQAQLTSAFLVSLLHGLIPSHWLPLVAYSNHQKWSRMQLLRSALLMSSLHALGTIIIGYLVYHTAHLSYIGSNKIDSETWMSEFKYNLPFEKLSAVILFLLGLVFLYRHYTHKHFHLDPNFLGKKLGKKFSMYPITIALAMFLSPCMEITGFYFSLAPLGFDAFLQLSSMYLITTVISITLGVWIFRRGLDKLNVHQWEHNSGIISSIMLLVSAVFMWFF